MTRIRKAGVRRWIWGLRVTRRGSSCEANGKGSRGAGMSRMTGASHVALYRLWYLRASQMALAGPEWSISWKEQLTTILKYVKYHHIYYHNSHVKYIQSVNQQTLIDPLLRTRNCSYWLSYTENLYIYRGNTPSTKSINYLLKYISCLS